MSQILAKLTYYKYYNNRAGFSLPSSLQQSIGVWRKRQALSTSSTDQPGKPVWPDFILTMQSFRFSIPAGIRLQQRCNLDSGRNGAYTFFPLNLQFGEASGDAPV
jgi:hypothetical protein